MTATSAAAAAAAAVAASAAAAAYAARPSSCVCDRRVIRTRRDSRSRDAPPWTTDENEASGRWPRCVEGVGSIKTGARGRGDASKAWIVVRDSGSPNSKGGENLLLARPPGSIIKPSVSGIDLDVGMRSITSERASSIQRRRGGQGRRRISRPEGLSTGIDV